LSLEFIFELKIYFIKLRYIELLWYGFESRSANRRNAKRQQREWQINTLPALSTLQRTNLTEGQSQVCLIKDHILNNFLTICHILQETNEPEIDYYLLMIHEDRDTALLSLLKSFMQCAPQLVLQIYLLAKHKQYSNVTTGIKY
jgi:hypothetical protein